MINFIKKLFGIDSFYKEEVIKTLTEKIFPGKPYIIDGRYSWISSSDKKDEQQLSIFFPNIPLAVNIQHVSRDKFFSSFRAIFGMSRKKLLHRDALIRKHCSARGIPLLVMDFGYPIDIEDLKLKIQELLSISRLTKRQT